MWVLPSLPSLVTHLGITEMDTGVGLNSQWTHCELDSISYFIPICLTLQGGSMLSLLVSEYQLQMRPSVRQFLK